MAPSIDNQRFRFVVHRWGSAAASTDAGSEAMAKVAAPVVPRKRRDNTERNGSILSTADPMIEC